MTEGEVSVSLGGILAPLLVGGLAATTLNWRFAFVIGAVVVAVAVAVSAAVPIPTGLRNPPPQAVGGGPSPSVRACSTRACANCCVSTLL